jgi:hypothetical protein
MKIIDKRTGVDIIKCEDIEILRNILIDSSYNNFKIMEEYGFFLIQCYKKGLPLLTAQEWLKIRNN